MRCSMSVSNPSIDSLASSRAVGYAHAHGQDGVETVNRAAARWASGLRTDDEARVAEAGVRGRTIYAAGTRSHRGIRDGLI